MQQIRERGRYFLKDFREFLLKQNALALAIGVIIGAATGKVVSSIADNVLTPIIGELLPAGDWRSADWELSRTVKDDKISINAIRYGALLGAVVDFIVIAFVVYFITKKFMPKPEEKKPETKECPQCLQVIPLAATRCQACTQPVL